MRINLVLQHGGALSREQWRGAAEAVSLRRGADLSFVGFHPPFVKKDLTRIREFSIDGILGMFGRADYAAFVRRLRVPCVSIFGGAAFAGIPQVGTDDRAIGAVAAEHLARPGIAAFGYFGLPLVKASDARWQGYSDALRREGRRVVRFRPESRRKPSGKYSYSRLIPWEQAIYAWLESLPKPAAVFCFDDLRAYWIAGACERMHLRIPDQVAVLGVGDDPGYVLAVTPHLSSVKIPSRQEGFEAATILMDMISGGAPPAKPVYLQPEGVTARPSTDILGVDNTHVARAVRFIREARGMGISVADVAARSGCCRKVLERLFRTHLDSTILREIGRERVEQVRLALRTTSDPIERVAEVCGYSSLNHLARDFKKRTGQPPGAYRRQFRLPI